MHSAVNADHFLRSIALAVARNAVGAMRPVHEILPAEGITLSEYHEIEKNPQFQRYRDAYVSELQDSGFSFAAKCKVLAEDLLPSAYHMVKDPDVPAAVRAKVIENLVEWADLKPKKELPTAQGAGFSITINIPATAQQPSETIVLANPDPIAVAGVAPTALVEFEEPEDYEYAGDDYA